MKPGILKTRKRLITHDNCPDGIASAMIIKSVLPDIEVEFVQYGSDRHRNMPAREGDMFCDFTPHRSRVEDWVRMSAVVLDHHKGAQGIVEQFGELGVFADEKQARGVSGAGLAFHEVWLPMATAETQGVEGAHVQDFAVLAGIRDTWQKDDPRWVEACEQAAALLFYGADHFLSETRTYPRLLPDEAMVGKLLFTKKIENAKKAAEQAFVHEGFAMINSLDTSDVGEQLRINRRGVDALAGFAYVTDDKTGDIRLVFSLRSIADGFDVAALAKANGGGGHTKAAGFTVEDPKVLLCRSPFDIFKAALAKAELTKLALYDQR